MAEIFGNVDFAMCDDDVVVVENASADIVKNSDSAHFENETMMCCGPSVYSTIE